MIVGAAVALALALQGCGSGRDKPKGALTEALSYLPADTAAALVTATDPDSGPVKKLDQIGSKFAGWDAFKEGLKREVRNQGLDYDDEIAPQLGNPAALGLRRNGEAVGAIRVQDPGDLRKALEKRVSGGLATRLPDYRSAFVTRDNSQPRTGLPTGKASLRFTAVSQHDLVAAQSLSGLKVAIDSRANGRNLAHERVFASSLAKLGADRLVRVVGDAQSLIESAGKVRAARARKNKWIRALGRLTAVMDVESDAVSVRFRVTSDREKLSNADLPIPPGPHSPFLHNPAAATAVGILEPGRLARVMDAALPTTKLGVFGTVGKTFSDLRRLGVDPEKDLFGKMKSLSVAVFASNQFSFVAPLEKGAAPGVERALSAAKPFVRRLGTKDFPVTGVVKRGPLWLVSSGGLGIAAYGVEGDLLVGSAGLVATPRAAPDQQVEGVNGALVAKAQASRLARALGPRLGVLGNALRVLSQLGDLTLGVRAETDALTGSGRLEIGKRG